MASQRVCLLVFRTFPATTDFVFVRVLNWSDVRNPLTAAAAAFLRTNHFKIELIRFRSCSKRGKVVKSIASRDMSTLVQSRELARKSYHTRK